MISIKFKGVKVCFGLNFHADLGFLVNNRIICLIEPKKS